MRIHHHRHRAMPLLALAMTAACGAACAQQPYRFGQPTGPAAPSTIPGQGDSTARVPKVDAAPVAMPRPRTPRPPPGVQPSPWGGNAPNTPATPPLASQPPVATRPPVASGPPLASKPPATQTGTPPAGPVVVVTPGQATPPPSQPPSGANDRLASAYRAGRANAIVRNGGATSAANPDAARIASPALACAKNGNTPTIARIRPANDASLQPGGAFIVEGVCFGDARGTVQVTLPTRYGRVQANDAQVLDWAGDKILAQLPEGVTKAIPGSARVDVAAGSGVRGPGTDVAFEPRWELLDLPGQGRIVECANKPGSALGNNTMEFCVIGDDRAESAGFAMPANRRGFGTDFGSAEDKNARFTFAARFYTPEDIDPGQANVGRVRFEMELPPPARLSHCGLSTTAFETVAGVRDATATLSLSGTVATVDYRLLGTGTPGWLSLAVQCKAWTPAGVGLQ